MAYSELLANRVREALMHLPEVVEIKMFQGLVFMVNDKMCIGVRENQIMCRLNPEEVELLVEKPGVVQMTLGMRIAKGYVFVSEEAYNKPDDFQFWVQKALDYNPIVKASKKRKKKGDK